MSEEDRKTIVLKIGGMHCASCALTIEKNLRRLPGVEKARVSFASEKATILFDPKKLSLREIEEAVEKNRLSSSI